MAMRLPTEITGLYETPPAPQYLGGKINAIIRYLQEKEFVEQGHKKLPNKPGAVIKWGEHRIDISPEQLAKNRECFPNMHYRFAAGHHLVVSDAYKDSKGNDMCMALAIDGTSQGYYASGSDEFFAISSLISFMDKKEKP